MSEETNTPKPRKTGSPGKPKAKRPKQKAATEKTPLPPPATNELQTENSKHPTEKMEVHHHPEVEKKGLKEYLLEGLMIFVAVFMGFIAENIREGIVEKHRETEYVREMA